MKHLLTVAMLLAALFFGAAIRTPAQKRKPEDFARRFYQTYPELNVFCRSADFLGFARLSAWIVQCFSPPRNF